MSTGSFTCRSGAAVSMLACACLLALPAAAGSVRFIAADQAAALPAIAIRTPKGTVTVTDLGPLKRSAAYQLPKGAEAVHLETTERKGADGKPASVSLAIDPAVKSPLVVILPDAEQAAGFRAVMLDDDSKNFPAGTCRFVNTSRTTLALRFGKRAETLETGGSTRDLSPEGGNVGVQLTEPDSPETILYSAVWQHEPMVRKLVLITSGADPKTTTVEVRVLPDVPAKGG